ncbi:MAG: polyprenyl synthetase family protein [Dethiobacter sp.]|nr:polyprenyl synthetase family protein [Dethiobacter sp.]
MEEVYGHIHLPLQELERELKSVLCSDEATVEAVTKHLLLNAGKRVRPALFFLCLRLWRQDIVFFMPIAVAIELIHSATLVHDDVVDNSLLRRGQSTINAGWGNQIAVLTGDYLFAKAFSLLTEFGQIRIISEMARVVSEMSKGEIQQQSERFSLYLDEEAYLNRISQKTSYFITACCSSAGTAVGAPAEAVAALRGYGYRIGMAFQIVDDLLDFSGDEAVTGKPTASDLRQGVFTLPVIHMLNTSPRGEEFRIELGKGEPTDDLVAEIRREMVLSQSLEYTRDKAVNYINEAVQILRCLPHRQERDALERLAYFILERRY